MTGALAPWQWVILIWFMCAVLAEVLITLLFAIWLRQRGVNLIFGMIGVPGYLELLYAQWNRAQGRSSRNWIAMRALMLANLVLAFVVALPIF